MRTFSSSDQAIHFINQTPSISYSDSFDLSRYCSGLLANKETERLGRDIVIRIKDCWHKLEANTIPIWNDLTEASGLYPYVETQHLSKSALLRYEYHRSPFLKDVFLHEEQHILSMCLQQKKAVVVSAPTSFGKSLLIEEVIASKIYKNIVIIQPTLALLDETRKKLLKYREDYKLIVSTSQEVDSSKGNIFLFTGERVVEYQEFPDIDFFVIDEFYKLSLQRDDDRSIALNQAFSRLLKQTSQFYLLGPMIKNIPVSFKEKFDLTWFPTEFATVAVDEISYEITDKLKIKEKKEEKKRLLISLLLKTQEQTLIYCASPNKATALGLEFTNELNSSPALVSDDLLAENNDMLEWIAENINERWSLIKAIKSGVAFHHGALPRHLGSSIVDAFNNGSIRFLFCTSTLIEGVNTSAKNVILYDKEKGNKKIDFFDYKNIAGRSGRMKKHFIGNVIRFEKQPDQMELFVDIPLFDQENAPLEILVSLDSSELEEKAKHRLNEFLNLEDEVQALIKKNSSINIEGQLAIIKEIEENIDFYHPYLAWNAYPKYDQLEKVINLAWTYLMKPGENKADVRNSGQLAVLAIKYMNLKSSKALINDSIRDKFWIEKIPEEQQRINQATFFILNVIRHWFDYKLPKWISVISELQDYVFRKHNLAGGSYGYFSSNLENGFLPPYLAILTEYDVPASAIRKIEQQVKKGSWTTENIIIGLARTSDERLKSWGLLNYEIKKLRNST